MHLCTFNFYFSQMFEYHIDQLIPNIFVIYFYYIKKFQILYTIYYKFNGAYIGLIIKFEGF